MKNKVKSTLKSIMTYIVASSLVAVVIISCPVIALIAISVICGYIIAELILDLFKWYKKKIKNRV